MEKINDGRPAFPEICTDIKSTIIGLEHNTYSYGGMTLRDYFAGQALVALLPAMEATNEQRDVISHYAATRSYELADAMLAARERKS